uniref:cobaltochelatase subunit CobN n=1 Tax=Methanobacterium sp. TaxID=2164 RepID=UPI00257FF764
SMVLYLLGMKPVWSDSPSAGIDGQKLKEMPEYIELEDLVRPEGWSKKRIDAVIITSGLFRDLYSRQAGLLDKAFRIALARSYYTILADTSLNPYYTPLKIALDQIMDGIGYYGMGSESLNDNYVAQNWVSDFKYYLELGIPPKDAGELAISRIFAPPTGDYGAGISKALQMSWTWNSTDDLAEYYLERMGHIYSQNNWGTSNPTVFARALTGVGTMYASRNTNLYGVLDNDDFVDYWGGLYNTIKFVNGGNAPNFNVLKYTYTNSPAIGANNAQLLTYAQLQSRELETRYLNPDYIGAMMNENPYTTYRYLSRSISILMEVELLAPELVTESTWNRVADIYINDKYNMGITEGMMQANPYAMQALSAKLYQAALTGAWHPNAATLQKLADLVAIAILDNGGTVSCCDCVCGNVALMTNIMNNVNPDLLAKLKNAMYQATGRQEYLQDSEEEEEQNPEKPKPQQPKEATAAQKGLIGATGDQPTTSTSTGTGAGTESDVGDQPGEHTGKSYEVSKSTPSGAAQSGLPFVTVIGVVLLVILVGVGYFKGNLVGFWSMFKK